MLSFLSDELFSAIGCINENKLYELRLRANKPVLVNYDGKYVYLTSEGLTDKRNLALCVSADDIENTVYLACKRSVYSYADYIKTGYITTPYGVRIGLGGDYVYIDGKISTVRDYKSLSIRVPHEIIGSGKALYGLCCADKPSNVLIIAPPGCGKTTILRDVASQIAKNSLLNVLICDERGEIFSNAYNFYGGVDVISFAKKTDAFSVGVRAMRPDVIITDEIVDLSEFEGLMRCKLSGVRVIASAHFSSVDELKRYFKPLKYGIDSLFNYIAVLKPNRLGEVQSIFDCAKDGYLLL